jgi:hypothetical protein
LDTSTIFTDNEISSINEWLNNLSKVERSEPIWIGSDFLTSISPSSLLEEQFTSLLPIGSSIEIFNGEERRRYKFDFDYRECFLKALPTNHLTTILDCGQSNTHPLRLQLVAIPPSTYLPLHVHTAIELDIPLLGEMHEYVSPVLLPAECVERPLEYQIGTPLSKMKTKTPTKDDLTKISNDISEHIILKDFGMDGSFVENTVQQGECLINQPGSIHQSYSLTSGCLLLALGPGVHAYFRPGNFHQRDGTGMIQNIDDVII